MEPARQPGLPRGARPDFADAVACSDPPGPVAADAARPEVRPDPAAVQPWLGVIVVRIEHRPRPPVVTVHEVTPMVEVMPVEVRPMEVDVAVTEVRGDRNDVRHHGSRRGNRRRRRTSTVRLSDRYFVSAAAAGLISDTACARSAGCTTSINPAMARKPNSLLISVSPPSILKWIRVRTRRTYLFRPRMQARDDDVNTA